MSIATTMILNAYLDRSNYVFANHHFTTNDRDVGASLQCTNCLHPFPTSPMLPQAQLQADDRPPSGALKDRILNGQG
jgi:hypothetical protein